MNVKCTVTNSVEEFLIVESTNQFDKVKVTIFSMDDHMEKSIVISAKELIKAAENATNI